MLIPSLLQWRYGVWTPSANIPTSNSDGRKSPDIQNVFFPFDPSLKALYILENSEHCDLSHVLRAFRTAESHTRIQVTIRLMVRLGICSEKQLVDHDGGDLAYERRVFY